MAFSLSSRPASIRAAWLARMAAAAEGLVGPDQSMSTAVRARVGSTCRVSPAASACIAASAASSASSAASRASSPPWIPAPWAAARSRASRPGDACRRSTDPAADPSSRAIAALPPRGSAVISISTMAPRWGWADFDSGSAASRPPARASRARPSPGESSSTRARWRSPSRGRAASRSRSIHRRSGWPSRVTTPLASPGPRSR